ncbi:hypothetical protein COV53_00565 [Candidatus Gottesmanbacteria bacterium CG11_big_fil_rev_8_21_14_0_20_37_11]|uniref:Uncharacterized protein n=3 Tax=Candidatus Gottesmaniibacteriota TaxID=1752720 RepID=A0A2M7RPY7_9BACT|nr:MAG: hypothetical protein AUJ73_01200 [Candidatus Gottesmanbacteria bacterium CG1_02_37_22]PIP32994.1 MAG: hypothetical protein COX23_01885 [Candidatus Gottesmanbacteria bacterium CG23_combo_of_CG06-09_8_20_14_all_37_19]PIR08891.1 MAG: hypothetical protein COV53_00565 [Candidatus Gottesmanbacteria bacterium CG11_big_fil_rev_8_21_14_0_20_37_11]PIZ02387.1 MAG: hypothetical protein COY59_05220 [Candidatus Gottesmanbacteria bacterium CG_4_10_14_0_8_um_filter_37_24]
MILYPAVIPPSQTISFYPKLSFWGKCETLYPLFFWLKFPLFIALIYGVLVFIIGIIGFIFSNKNDNKIIAKKRIKRALIIFVIYFIFLLINAILRIDVDFIIGGCAPHREIWGNNF